LYVEELLKIYRKYHELVVVGFKNDLGFSTSLDKACRRYINNNSVCAAAKSPSKSPELVARFTDQLLKKSNKGADPTEVERLLDDVVRVSLSLPHTVPLSSLLTTITIIVHLSLSLSLSLAKTRCSRW